MEIEQISSDMAMKEAVQEVREVGKTSSDEAKEMLTSTDKVFRYGQYRPGTSLKLTKMRGNTIFNTARAYATQAALAWRYQQINEVILKKYAGAFDQAISFRPFIEKGVILVPSVLESRNEEELKEGTLTELSASYVIDEEAAIITQPPTFRNYLIKEFPAPMQIHEALKPQNDEEEKLWNQGKDIGWALGISQADEIFMDGFNEMIKDVVGRITYLKLKKLNMIGSAELQVTQSGVTFNGRAMNVGEVISTISSQANYKAMEGWRTAWSIPQEGSE